MPRFAGLFGFEVVSIIVESGSSSLSSTSDFAYWEHFADLLLSRAVIIALVFLQAKLSSRFIEMRVVGLSNSYSNVDAVSLCELSRVQQCLENT
jgi:hypothetical protein